MNKKKISAEIIADSLSAHGQRITTYVLTFPRMILAELNTHRVFSKNSASSRAIPFKTFVENIEEDPFIPIAFQLDHSGMQGTDYLEGPNHDFAVQEWLMARDFQIARARIMNKQGSITKQLCNRLLEPFAWHTVILTGTEFENFFNLRCPQYKLSTGDVFKSWKEVCKATGDSEGESPYENDSILRRLYYNKGQGEIHMMALAEAMYDAMNESTPKRLRAGEWHIPFGDKIDTVRLLDEIVNPFGDLDNDLDEQDRLIEEAKIKIATARCARVSYLNYEGKDDYLADIKLFGRLSSMGHYSPFEHCAKAMDEKEYYSSINGVVPIGEDENGIFQAGTYPKVSMPNSKIHGWCRNFRGFIQLRVEID